MRRLLGVDAVQPMLAGRRGEAPGLAVSGLARERREPALLHPLSTTLATRVQLDVGTPGGAEGASLAEELMVAPRLLGREDVLRRRRKRR